MTIIETLSKLPHNRLDRYRLALNAVIVMDPFGFPETVEMIQEINEALEIKDKDYFTMYEDITENNTLGV